MLRDSFKYFKEVYIALFLLLFIILGGTVGFMLVEEFTLLDSFYMTIITLSTVGFREVHPLSDAGRLFTATLIITSFGIFAYAISSITRYLLTGQYRMYFKDYKVNREISKLKGHVIVCGYGRNGIQAVNTLAAYKKDYVVIEQSDELIERLKLNNQLYVRGDATTEETLYAAGIEDASALVTTLPKDAENVFVVLTSRELNKDLTIISRASADTSYRKLRIAGANNVIMPDKLGGSHMASLVVNPDVYEFLDHISVMGSNEINLEEITFSHIPEQFRFKTLGDLNDSYTTGCLIIGYKTPEGEYIVNPSMDLEIIPRSKLFVLGRQEQIEALNDIFKIGV